LVYQLIHLSDKVVGTYDLLEGMTAELSRADFHNPSVCHYFKCHTLFFSGSLQIVTNSCEIFYHNTKLPYTDVSLEREWTVPAEAFEGFDNLCFHIHSNMIFSPSSQVPLIQSIDLYLSAGSTVTWTLSNPRHCNGFISPAVFILAHLFPSWFLSFSSIVSFCRRTLSIRSLVFQQMIRLTPSHFTPTKVRITLLLLTGAGKTLSHFIRFALFSRFAPIFSCFTSILSVSAGR
jgi:hypothetical protein